MLKEDIIDWRDLAPSHYHPFSCKKEDLLSKHYASNEELKSTVMKWLKKLSTEFYEVGIHVIQGWNIAIERNDDYVEK